MTTPSPTLARPAPPASHPSVAAPRPAPAGRRLAGRYRYDRRTGTWTWSPEMSALLGLGRGGSHPCTELLVRSLHTADRARTLESIATACTSGLPFALRVRLCSRGGIERTAVLVGEPVVDAVGTVDALEGLFVEVPPDVHRGAPTAPPGRDDGDLVQALETEVSQLRTAMSSRAAIEQAKGILMLLTGCGDQVAFETLAHISSNCHRKVRDVAVTIVESACGRAPLPDDIRGLIRDVCPPTPRMH
ncbi:MULTISPECIES: ANTAR domain-containing protein [unclassified Geodermatophilus]|uniref:ANTAR domain-containing protein n=1 Tax=unclassified Geodermatophilus TaxID=2637632 RepID=UPI003EEEEE6C